MNLAHLDNLPFQDNYNFHKAWVKCLVENEFTHFLTFQWCCPINLNQLESDMKYLHMRVDRYLHGPRFNRFDGRTQAIFFAEGEEYFTLHCHSAWKIPDRDKLKFEGLFLPNQHGPLWREIAPAGTYDCDEIRDQHKVLSYITKENDVWDVEEKRILFSQDFIPSGRKVAP